MADLTCRYDDGQSHVNLQDDGQGGTEGGQNGRRPEGLPQEGWYVQNGSHHVAILVLKGIQHGDVLSFSHLAREEEAAHRQTDGVAPGGLGPHESGPVFVNGFGCSVDLASADPGCCHCEATDD